MLLFLYFRLQSPEFSGNRDPSPHFRTKRLFLLEPFEEIPIPPTILTLALLNEVYRELG